MRRLQWILIVLLVMLASGCQDSQNSEVDMQESKYRIEEIRSRYETKIMAIPGVVGVGIGTCKSGNECLKIYTSIPEAQVQNNLPAELSKIEVELEFVGDIKAQ